MDLQNSLVVHAFKLWSYTLLEKHSVQFAADAEVLHRVPLVTSPRGSVDTGLPHIL
jgi:hypothetical protein